MSTPVTPDKSLGQHFLNNPRVIERIVMHTGQPGHVIEIGPGTGALTRALLEAGFTVTALEIDTRCATYLQTWAEHGQTLHVVQQDALKADWPTLLQNTTTIVGNLPYNVGTEIVANLVQQGLTGGPRPSHMVFMLQKEVIQRICATEESPHWGRLGVLCNLLANCRSLFDVAPGNFTPPPKVMSSVVEITPLPAPRYPVNLKKLDILLRQSFGQRRKMLRASLKGVLSEEQITHAGIPATARPEELSTQQLCHLSNLLP